jgi:hypothetical protein
MHAAKCGSAPSVSIRSGSVLLHSSIAIGHRGVNGHPGGRFASEGGLPAMGVNRIRSSVSMRGSELSRPTVYGIRGR